MEDENKNRINVDDLPQAAEEVTDEEAKNVEGGLTKQGAGTLILGAANTYTGTTSVNDGTLNVNPDAVNNTIGGSLS